jgi:predicted HTH domain antitoxin
MTATATTSSTPAVGNAETLTDRLVALIERGDHVSVARAAAIIGVPLQTASLLVRLRAIELEAAESELEERMEDVERQCPREDWWSYTDRQQTAIFRGSAIPNRIVRELVETWQQCTGHGTGRLAAALEITDEALRRSLGMVALPSRIKYGRRYRSRKQKTIRIDAAGRIVRALGIPPCEVPGL